MSHTGRIFEAFLSVLFIAMVTGCSGLSANKDGEAGTLYVFNIKDFLGTIENSVAEYDYFKLATALQGLANRDKPQIYYIYEITEPNNLYGSVVDEFWLTHLSAKGKYLSNYRIDYTRYPPTPDGFFSLLKGFSACYNGFVLWDHNVPATANVASTIAGADNLLPVPDDSALYDSLFGAEGGFSTDDIKINLTGKFTNTTRGNIPDTDIPSTGSAKNDAYLWAKDQYLDAGRTNPLRMAYCTDSWIKTVNWNEFETTLANADFHIAHKAFFWDLSPDHRIAPIDDRNQRIGEDVRTLNALLSSQAKQSGFTIFNVAGFVPWNYKYTSTSDPEVSNMGDVESEWTMINRISSYGGQLESDANAGVGDVSNLSVLSHVPLNAALKQSNNKGANNRLKYDPDTHYIMIYMGDYDSASWASNILPMYWEKGKKDRGKYPLAWPIASGISGRIPHVYNYLYENATRNDFFVAGDNGTAYLNATTFEPEFRPEGMPDMLPVWEKYNTEYNTRFDIDIMGLYINTTSSTIGTPGLSQRLRESLSRMYPVGVSAALIRYPGYLSFEENPENGTITPFLNYRDIGGGAGLTALQLAENIYNTINSQNGYQKNQRFHNLRCVLIPPGVINEALDLLASGKAGNKNNLKYKVVDPYTLYKMAVQSRNNR